MNSNSETLPSNRPQLLRNRYSSWHPAGIAPTPSNFVMEYREFRRRVMALRVQAINDTLNDVMKDEEKQEEEDGGDAMVDADSVQLD